eukprot:457481-Pleurochrysis_carterae.AAC.1
MMVSHQCTDVTRRLPFGAISRLFYLPLILRTLMRPTGRAWPVCPFCVAAATHAWSTLLADKRLAMFRHKSCSSALAALSHEPSAVWSNSSKCTQRGVSATHLTLQNPHFRIMHTTKTHSDGKTEISAEELVQQQAREARTSAS